MIKQVRPNYDAHKMDMEIQEFWNSTNAYEKTKAYRSNGPDFYFLDGPPYTTGSIHLGTAMNKTLKDVLIRYWRMNGLNVRDQPGFDMHGLPIEVQVEKEIGVRSKKEIEEYGIDRFVETCKKFALTLHESMTEQFKQLGVWMDWDNPYQTLKPSYLEAAWWTIAKAYERGLLEMANRVLTWCPRCETALAEAEIEYWDEEDPSIFVKFPLKDGTGYLLIWTTTPWTLPANMAVAVHPDHQYVRASMKKDGQSEKYIVMESQLETVAEQGGYSDLRIIQTMSGKDLEGIAYLPPFEIADEYIKPTEWTHKVVLANYVESDNTGLVHTAPGHGPDDFETGKRYGLNAFCPVDEAGKFTREIPQFEGQKAQKTNHSIVEDLRYRNLLFHNHNVQHRYGHCWRCRSSVIYRNTDQWFVKVEDIKEKMLSEVERVTWNPEWAGTSREYNWVQNARDWCVSRQRYWGIPIPVWTCDCGKIKVIGSFDELREGRGYIEGMDPHRPWIDSISFRCTDCGADMRRVSDVLDVWFDSGVAAWAQLGYPHKDVEFNKWWPGRFITEAHDQTRGWFYSQLAAGVISFDRSPYEEVLMHGWVLDPKGQKMSKSKGNVIEPLALMQENGVDSVRLYMMKANAPWEDTAFQKDGPKNARKILNTLWNVVNFATTYMSLDSYEPSKHTMVEMEKHFRNEDRWMISKTERLKREVTEHMDTRNLHKAARALEEYIQEDLSRWYVRLIRDRMWSEQGDHDKLASYFVLHYALLATIRLMAPFCPHITEEIYRNLDAGMDTIHMNDWPSFNEALIDDSLEYSMKLIQEIVEISASERQKNNVKLRWPLKRMVVAGETNIINESISSFEHVLLQQANLKTLEYVEPPQIWKDMKLQVIPNPHAIGKVYRQWSSKIARLLETRPPQQVKEAVEKGVYEIGIEGQFLKIEPNMVSFSYENPESVVMVKFSSGVLYLDFQVTPEIEAEGYTRELIRRIQQMRKDLKLDVEEYVRTEVGAPDKLIPYFKTWKQHVMKETRSRSIIFAEDPQGDEIKEWDVQGSNIKVAISSLKMSNVSESFSEMSFLGDSDIVALTQAGYYDIKSLQNLSQQQILNIPGLRIAEAMKVAEYLKKEELEEAGKKAQPQEIEKVRSTGIRLERSSCYMINAKNPNRGMDALAEATSMDMKTMVISRHSPAKLPRIEEMPAIKTIWLSSLKQEGSFEVQDIDQLQGVIESFYSSTGGAILLDGLDYLVKNNDFQIVLRMVQNIRDCALVNAGIIILSLEYGSLGSHEINLLEREADKIL